MVRSAGASNVERSAPTARKKKKKKSNRTELSRKWLDHIGLLEMSAPKEGEMVVVKGSEHYRKKKKEKRKNLEQWKPQKRKEW